MKVYQCINKVQSALSKIGISKDSTNSQQGYKFRGIDAVYGALAPLLSEHGLCILPRVLTRTSETQPSKSGGILFYVTVEVEFDFVCAEDGSKHVVKTFGEAMDSGDKATNKAMSAAYKYAAFQAFSIPTEGDNDADAQTHEAKWTAEDTRKATEYAKRMMDAVQEGADLRAVDIWNEIKANHEFGTAVWQKLPSTVKDMIRTHMETAAKE